MYLEFATEIVSLGRLRLCVIYTCITFFIPCAVSKFCGKCASLISFKIYSIGISDLSENTLTRNSSRCTLVRYTWLQQHAQHSSSRSVLSLILDKNQLDSLTWRLIVGSKLQSCYTAFLVRHIIVQRYKPISDCHIWRCGCNVKYVTDWQRLQPIIIVQSWAVDSLWLVLYVFLCIYIHSIWVCAYVYAQDEDEQCSRSYNYRVSSWKCLLPQSRRWNLSKCWTQIRTCRQKLPTSVWWAR